MKKHTQHGIEFVSFGPTLFEEHETEHLHMEQIDTVFYCYEYADYAWSGVMVTRRKDGTFAKNDVGHCSCYGPIETPKLHGIYTKEEAVKLIEDFIKEESWSRKLHPEYHEGLNRMLDYFKQYAK